MRGEHDGDGDGPMVGQGSSPHARGTPSVRVPHVNELGIIPACAGNTKTVRVITECSWDHPRMRGEHMKFAVQQDDGSGSSPHARGTQTVRGPYVFPRGIIPACAGNTLMALGIRGVPRDHPRMRGEHWPSSTPLTSRPGSSPHARGTHPNIKRETVFNGIIPACAGNTTTTATKAR